MSSCIAAVVGIVVQSSRSKTENTKVVTPKHGLGPNGSEIEGDASAPVLVQEYADFQCPSCKLFHDRVQSTVDRLVGGREDPLRLQLLPLPRRGVRAGGRRRGLRR